MGKKGKKSKSKRSPTKKVVASKSSKVSDSESSDGAEENPQSPDKSLSHGGARPKVKSSSADGQGSSRSENVENQPPAERPKIKDFIFDKDNPPSEEDLSRHLLDMSMEERFNVGDVIFESAPLAYVLLQRDKNIRCDRCLFKSRNLMECDDCKYVKYCSTKCKEQAWESLHKYECSSLKNLGDRRIIDFHRFMALIIMVMKQPRADEISDQVGRYLVSFTEVNGNEEDFYENLSSVESLHDSFEILLTYLGETQMVSFVRYKTIYAKVSCHMMKITTGLRSREIGVALYLGESMIENSCLPTTCHTFIGPILRLTSNEEIPGKSWKYVTINRLTESQTLERTGIRRYFLKQKYLFECECVRCMDDEFDEDSTRILNKNRADSIFPQINAIKIYPPAAANECKPYIQQCENALRAMHGVYGPYNTKRIEIMKNLADALFTARLYKRCRNALLDYMVMLERNGPIHIEMTRVLFLLSKVEIHLGNGDLAKSIMYKALCLMAICYGADHPDYLNMVSVYQYCEVSRWESDMVQRLYPKNLDDYC